MGAERPGMGLAPWTMALAHLWSKGLALYVFYLLLSWTAGITMLRLQGETKALHKPLVIMHPA